MGARSCGPWRSACPRSSIFLLRSAFLLCEFFLGSPRSCVPVLCSYVPAAAGTMGRLVSSEQRIYRYISDRTHSIPLRLLNMCLTQPLPALSVVCIEYTTPTTWLSDRAGRGWVRHLFGRRSRMLCILSLIYIIWLEVSRTLKSWTLAACTLCTVHTTLLPPQPAGPHRIYVKDYVLSHFLKNKQVVENRILCTVPFFQLADKI